MSSRSARRADLPALTKYKLSVEIYTRYLTSNSLSDLNNAIAAAERAATSTKPSHPQRALRLSHVCKLLATRMGRTGDVQQDFPQAHVRSQETQVIIEAAGAIEPEVSENMFALFYMIDKLGLGDPRMMMARRRGKKHTPIPPFNPAHGPTDTLGDIMNDPGFRRGVSGGNPSMPSSVNDINTAILNVELAVLGSDDSHPERHLMYSMWSMLLLQRYKHGTPGNVEDLNGAVKHMRNTIRTMPSKYEERETVVSDYATLLHLRHERLGKLEDLKEAIRLLQKAVETVPVTSKYRPSILANYASIMTTLFDVIGETDNDFKEAQKYCEKALEATNAANKDDLDMQLDILSLLGGLYLQHYTRLGCIEDLEKAINYNEDSLKKTSDDHPARIWRLSNMATMLMQRYVRLQNQHDIEYAIKYCEEILAMTPLGHQRRGKTLSQMGSALFLLSQRTEDGEHLTQAIDHGEQALKETPLDDPTRASIHQNLTHWLCKRVEQQEQKNDLEEALAHASAAVHLTPPGHADQAQRVNNLSGTAYRLFTKTSDPEMLDYAIQLAQDALTLTPKDNPTRVYILLNLANYTENRYIDRLVADDSFFGAPQQSTTYYLTRLKSSFTWFSPPKQHTELCKDFAACITAWIAVWNCTAASPALRMVGAREAGERLAKTGIWNEANTLLADAVQLMPKFSQNPVERADREHVLSTLSGLSADAASIALQDNEDAYTALKLLEIGRGVILGLAIDCRRDVFELQAVDEELWRRFDGLRSDIDNVERVELEPEQQTKLIQRRKKAFEEMEDTLTTIRTLPGFTDFLLPPSEEALMATAAAGPVVVVNATCYRCDAILVTSSSIRSIPLTRLEHKDVKEWMDKMDKEIIRGPMRTYAARNRKMCELLLWLWDTCVGPIFSALGFLETSKKDLPHVWWIGVGPLSRAPFHAAGDHGQGSTRNAFSCAISSYIPTIKALSYARQKPLNLASSTKPRMLLVAMPTTPGESSLPGVTKEVAEISSLNAEQNIETTIEIHPSASRVLEQMREHSIVHFACHGISDAKNPSQSRLLLKCQESIPELQRNEISDPLTVTDISANQLSSKLEEGSYTQTQIAYLSACSTADNASVPLADEVIHIASGFQMAGLAHVLATMWEGKDSVCKDVAAGFYRELFKAGEGRHKEVSKALHEGVGRVRAKGGMRGKPLAWAPFIHTGA